MRSVGWRAVWSAPGLLGIWSPDQKTYYGKVKRVHEHGTHWLAYGIGGVPLGVGFRMEKREAAELVFRSWELGVDR